MKSHLWKLALLAGVVWAAILIRQNVFSSTVPTPETPGAVEPTATPIESTSVPEPGPTESTPIPVVSRSLPASPTATATPVPVLYTVREGDIPLAIAAEYDISVEALMEVNQISDPTGLQIGQELRIPITATPTPLPAEPDPVAPTPARTPVYHTVQQGEILLSIADEYSTTVEAIMVANDIVDPRTLRVGQELVIPPDKGSPLGVKTAIHEIAGGDTLLGLARRYGSTVEDIMATNPDLEPTLLRVGQEIVIPLTQRRLNPEADPFLPRIETPAEAPPELVAMAGETIEAVNAERLAAGYPALAPDEALARVALAHAQDMVARGYFSHVTLEGLSLRDRLEAQGLVLNWVGENIQRNTQPPDLAAQHAVEWFMGSRPHRNNILHDHFERVGVGVAEGPPGWYTFVLNFAGDS